MDVFKTGTKTKMTALARSIDLNGRWTVLKAASFSLKHLAVVEGSLDESRNFPRYILGKRFRICDACPSSDSLSQIAQCTPYHYHPVAMLVPAP